MTIDSPTQSLRSIVEQRLGDRWETFAQAHPNLAAAIDRVQLAQSVVSDLRGDAQFIEAMHQADLDEAKLRAAAKLLSLVDRWINRHLP